MTYEVRYQRGAQCEQNDHADHNRRPDCHLVVAQPYPGQLPRTTTLDGLAGGCAVEPRAQVRGLPPVSESLLLPSSGRQGFAILDGEVASHGMVWSSWSGWPRAGSSSSQRALRSGTAWMEPAAGGRVDR